MGLARHLQSRCLCACGFQRPPQTAVPRCAQAQAIKLKPSAVSGSSARNLQCNFTAVHITDALKRRQPGPLSIAIEKADTPPSLDTQPPTSVIQIETTSPLSRERVARPRPWWPTAAIIRNTLSSISERQALQTYTRCPDRVQPWEAPAPSSISPSHHTHTPSICGAKSWRILCRALLIHICSLSSPPITADLTQGLCKVGTKSSAGPQEIDATVLPLR